MTGGRRGICQADDPGLGIASLLGSSLPLLPPTYSSSDDEGGNEEDACHIPHPKSPSPTSHTLITNANKCMLIV